MSTKLTTAEVAARLGVSQPTVKLWCRQGKFPGAELDASSPRGPVWLIPESDLRDFAPPKMGRPPKAKPEAQPAKRRGRKAA
jgi:excisionase family DNA binding protein